MSFNYTPFGKIEMPELEYKDNITLEKDDTILLIIDMQNDFVKKNGKLSVPSASDTIGKISSLQNLARKEGVKVFFTQDSQIKNDKEFDIWPEHCIINTPGWEIIEELKPMNGELIFRKNRYDGFYNTGLEHYLSHVYDIKNIIIVGTVANICVAQTAASAGLRWYNVIMPADGISAMNEFDQALTFRQTSFLYNGQVIKSCSGISFK